MPTSKFSKHTTQGGLLIWHGMTIGGVTRLMSMKPSLHWSRLHRILSLPATGAYNSVMSGMESAIYGRRIRDTTIDEPPLFVLGYWRSGTTFLQNLLIRDSQFQHLGLYRALFPWHFLLTEKVVTKLTAGFVPTTRPMDNIAVHWDAAQEDDVALCVMTQISPCMLLSHPHDFSVFWHALDFKRLTAKERTRWKTSHQLLAKKLTYVSGKRLLLKSPFHTYHIPTLLELYPGAKFLYLHRNPYDVFRSTCHLRRTLISENTLGKNLFEGTEEQVIQTYKAGFEAYERDKTQIPNGCLSEIAYDDLTADPMTELRRIYSELELQGFDQLSASLSPEISSLKQYKKNQFVDDAFWADRVYQELRECFEHFGYDSPNHAGAP